MDEASFNSWIKPSKTFKGLLDNIRIVLTKKRHARTTMFGAIGSESLKGGLVN